MPHLCVQQVVVVHGLFQPSLTFDVWTTTLRTDELINTALLNGCHEERLEARLTQEAGTVRHRDDLQERE